MALATLPIDDVIPELLAALRRQANAVLRAPTGSGKTTRIPPALLDAGLAGAGRILLLEPRRLAARAAARRIAFERGQRVGDEIGFQVRFEKCCTAHTRLLAITPGVLLRYLHDDPFLESTSAVIFDEFHERGLESDLALALARHVQKQVRPELKLVAMSATLAVEPVAAFLDPCAIITADGRTFPVEIRYLPKPPDRTWSAAAAAAVEHLLEISSGDVLVFLPGWSEIRQTARELEAAARNRDVLVMPLHGDLPAEEQDRALQPQSRRRVVLATNVAESSVTVEGITGVVDTGLARQLRFDPAIGLDRLELLPIARACADQRSGRAGRTQPGICIRLWSELQQRARPEQTEPEIHHVDLSGAVLQLHALGERDLATFPWYEAPPAAALAQAQRLLQHLGALAGEALTELGQTLARLPTAPRLGRLLLAAQQLGVARAGALAAAVLTERDPFVRTAAPRTTTRSDLLERVEALEEFERTSNDRTPFGVVQPGAARFLLRVRDQLLHQVERERKLSDRPRPTTNEPLLQALVYAFPDRLARRREPGSKKGVMVGGRGVQLAPASGVTESELFLCLDIDASAGEGWVRQASAVRREWLPEHRLTTTFEVSFNTEAERVEARRVTRFEDLILDDVPTSLPDAADVERVLLEAARLQLARVLPAEDEPASSLLARIRWLRNAMPELNLPAFDNPQISELLPWLCAGCKSFAGLRRADWFGLLCSRLTHAQRTAVDREAPERLQVPSGSWLRLKYEPDRPPILAVRIQELFGLVDTPRLAAGRVRVLLHLLAPNYRPQQITDDLARFWANTYAQVRKDLRARYPKHAWPENPCAAQE